MLSKIQSLPGTRPLLPFLILSYGSKSEYLWEDEDGNISHVEQGESGEQGDPLMPYLFSLGIHDALAQVAKNFKADEHIFGFLDDVYVVSEPDRTEAIFQVLARELHSKAGIQLHLGKTRVWNKDGVLPAGVATLGAEVWSPDGIVVLGTPIGSNAFCQAKADERIDVERRLWEDISNVPGVQCAWQISSQSAGPRCSYFSRTMPPTVSEAYAKAHDNGMWSIVRSLMGVLQDLAGEELSFAMKLCSLPARLGGLGLRSASRTSPAAYSASWADALPIIFARNRRPCDRIFDALSQPAAGYLGELQTVRNSIILNGFHTIPSWIDLVNGQRPPAAQVPGVLEPGEWEHGWQFHASSHSEFHFRRTMVLSRCDAAARAHVRAHSGPNALCFVDGTDVIRCDSRTIVIPNALLEKLQLPLPITDAVCEGCGSSADCCGRHRASCPSSGLL